MRARWKVRDPVLIANRDFDRESIRLEHEYIESIERAEQRIKDTSEEDVDDFLHDFGATPSDVKKIAELLRQKDDLAVGDFIRKKFIEYVNGQEGL
jgi:hypothetical protein